jgi:hypothetical protein
VAFAPRDAPPVFRGVWCAGARRVAVGCGRRFAAGLVDRPDVEPWRCPGPPRTALRFPGAPRDFPFHARRAFASRHVRLEAAPRARPRQAAAVRAAARRLERDGQSAPLAVEVRPPRAKRHRRERALSTRRRVRGRPLRRQLDARLELETRRRAPRAPHGQRHFRAAEHGLVDHVRPRLREPRSPGLRHDLSCAGSWRRQQLVERLFARGLPGDADRQRENALRPGPRAVHSRGSRCEPCHAAQAPAARTRPHTGTESAPGCRGGVRPAPRGTHRSVRARFPDAVCRARAARRLGRDRRDAAALRLDQDATRNFGGSASWREGSPSAACASCR